MSDHTIKLLTPITEALESDPAIDKRDVPARVWRQMAEFERDCMTLALRLYMVPPATFSVETEEVMARWRPRVQTLLERGEV